MLEQVIISVQIILIDIVMAADNAIIIGLIAAGFATDNRRKIIAWGVAAAFLFRIVFASGANYLFEFAWIKILGGVLLLFAVVSFAIYGIPKRCRRAGQGERGGSSGNRDTARDTLAHSPTTRGVPRHGSRDARPLQLGHHFPELRTRAGQVGRGRGRSEVRLRQHVRSASDQSPRRGDW